ncbi:MAG: biotin/lipoyl-binding protein [Anaerolineae bacterium]|nr:biotin/lipoyl-binding protein [Anaerolineae bacterium]
MSEQSLRVIVNGKPYLVEVDDLTASPISVRVNGKPFSVEIEPLRELPVEGVGEPGAGVPSPFDSAHDMPAEVPAAPKAVGAPGPSVKEVIAPMPGNIMDIRVGVGDHVSYKQELCNLEAMKMKNSIRSPRDGVIAAIKVREGQTVAYGDVLFVFQ